MLKWTTWMVLAASLVAGCDGLDGGACPDGAETCPCYGNDSCDDGLDCASGVCVDLSSTSAFGAGDENADAAESAGPSSRQVSEGIPSNPNDPSTTPSGDGGDGADQPNFGNGPQGGTPTPVPEPAPPSTPQPPPVEMTPAVGTTPTTAPPPMPTPIVCGSVICEDPFADFPIELAVPTPCCFDERQGACGTLDSGGACQEAPEDHPVCPQLMAALGIAGASCCIEEADECGLIFPEPVGDGQCQSLTELGANADDMLSGFLVIPDPVDCSGNPLP